MPSSAFVLSVLVEPADEGVCPTSAKGGASTATQVREKDAEKAEPNNLKPQINADERR